MHRRQRVVLGWNEPSPDNMVGDSLCPLESPSESPTLGDDISPS